LLLVVFDAICWLCVQFYRDTMDVSDDVKPAAAAADAKATSTTGTSLDNSATEDVTALTDSTDVDVKTEEGRLLLNIVMNITPVTSF